MSVAYWLITLVILAAGLCLVILRRRSPAPNADVEKSPYHCISVVPGGDACEAVRTLTQERYFPEEAPPLLPVPGCTAQRCQCHYKHHADRRYRARRSAELSPLEQLSGESDRRNAPGRRGTEPLAANVVEPAANPHPTRKTQEEDPCGSHPH